MSIKLEDCVLMPLEEEQLSDVVKNVKDWAALHGAAMRDRGSYNEDELTFAPFTLTPSSWPQKLFVEAVNMQRTVNLLMHRVANDREFLATVLSDVIKVDDFTSKLYNIYRNVLNAGHTNPLDLAIIRNDLMLEIHGSTEDNKACDLCTFKQVEVNTIAAGFGHLGPISKAIHEYVLHELQRSEKIRHMPVNKALHGICAGIVRAFDFYKNSKGVILFVVEDVPYNIADQRFHEFYIRKHNPDIVVIRRTLTEVHTTGRLNENRALIVGKHEVAVVYFRAGYVPAHYPTENEWAARQMIESSIAIKSPSIHFQLAGTKKVQQVLAQPGMLERFLPEPEDVAKIRHIFTGLYELGDSELGIANYKRALETPERFVLKPQREGGGHNIYGADIPEALKKIPRKDQAAWILMDIIKAPLQKGYIIRPGDEVPPPVVEMVSELGIFGVIIGTSEEIHHNTQVGHMLRSKLATENEGGVATGLGALDSPYLVD